MRRRSNLRGQELVTPASNLLLEQCKAEIAEELGIMGPIDEHMGQMSSRDVGAIGGKLTQKRIELAQKQFEDLNLNHP